MLRIESYKHGCLCMFRFVLIITLFVTMTLGNTAAAAENPVVNTKAGKTIHHDI